MISPHNQQCSFPFGLHSNQVAVFPPEVTNIEHSNSINNILDENIKRFTIKKKALYVAYIRYRILDLFVKISTIIIGGIATLFAFLSNVNSWFDDSTRRTLAIIATIITGTLTVMVTVAGTIKSESKTLSYRQGTQYCGGVLDEIVLVKYQNLSLKGLIDKFDFKNKELASICEFPIPASILTNIEKQYE